MKLFIPNIILLVVLQKCEKVLTSSDNLEEATGLSDTNEQIICVICQDEMNVNDFKHPCCNGIYHKKCLYKSISFNILSCPNCRGNPIEDIRICNNCKSTKYNNELEKMKCCGIDLCKNCVNSSMKTQCSCREDLVNGIVFSHFRLCISCRQFEGKYTFSSRCPQMFCKECFNSLRNQNDGRCSYCGEKTKKKKSFLCFS
ncbi:uncharacterized protein LOC126897410 isoform X3 [Daktulosphaira vitifoliae]|uniref:uncharacterized protein LOC126897410 isoform X3 n=1 Tax=Daktulosphaira vitifoliae TaxID=58002 RepID=UPI0021AA98AA|nr:uncharacterized protein LOC126897410 isoform X3 [Daktulosphaira vitifoliae]